MKLSIALHIIGICLWLGSLILGSRFFAIAADGPALPPKSARSAILFTVIGFVVTLVTGIYQIAVRGTSFYFSQGWFHTKLTFVIVLIILTIIFVSHLKSVGAGTSQPRKSLLMMIHGISSMILIGLVCLTVMMGSVIQ